MAQLLRVLNQFEKTKPYCRMALDLIPGIDDPKIIANIYNEYAYLSELSGKLDSAGFYCRKLTDISTLNDFREGRYMKALELKKKGLDIDLASEDTYGIMTS